MSERYRISVDLKNKDRFDFLEDLSEKFYNGNKSKAIRKLLDKVKEIGESN